MYFNKVWDKISRDFKWDFSEVNEYYSFKKFSPPFIADLTKTINAGLSSEIPAILRLLGP